MASATDKGVILFWNLENKTKNQYPVSIKIPNTAMRAIVFSPNQSNDYLLASASDDNTIRLWDTTNVKKTLRNTLEGHSDIVLSVAFSIDGKMLVSGSKDKTVRLWHINNLDNSDIKPEKIIDHKGAVFSVDFSSDGQMIASGSEDQTVHLWKFNSQDETKQTNLNFGHNYGVSSVAFSPDNQRLVSGSWDKTIRIWNLRQPQALPRIIGRHDDNIMSITVSSDGEWLVSGSWDKTVKLWNLKQPNLEPKFVGRHEGQVFAVVFDRKSRKLASASADQKIRIWNLQNFEEEPCIIAGHQDGVSSMSLSPDGRWLASGSWDANLILWNLDNPNPNGNIVAKILWRHEIKGENTYKSITSVAFSPDGNMLVSGSDDHTIQFLNLEHMNLSWDYIYDQSNSHCLENPVVEPIILKGHDARVWSVTFSPDSKLLASGSDDMSIRLWDVSKEKEEPKCVNIFEGHNFWVSSVAFSPDGQKLASGGYDKTIRIWDLNHLNEDQDPVVLKGHEQSVTSIAFFPDGKKLISGSYDNTIREWIIDLEILADMVCEKVQRNLTQKEWDSFMSKEIPYEKTCLSLPPGEGISEVRDTEEVNENELEREFRVKHAQLYTGQKELLYFINQKTAQGADFSEQDINNFLNKPLTDEGTYFRLENLRLLGFLDKSFNDKNEKGRARYDLSEKYKNYLRKKLEERFQDKSIDILPASETRDS